MPDEMKALTTRQSLFVEAYLVNPNASEAALKAGYSPKSAYSQGQRLLKNVEIKQALAGRVQAAIISADEVLNGIKEIALARGEKTADRLKAYELLGKHLALFTDRTQHDGGLTIQVEYITDGDGE